VVETLAQEFDIIDVAAAAVQMAHSALGGDGDDKEIPAVSTHPPKDREPAGPRGRDRGCSSRRAGACRARRRPAARRRPGCSSARAAGPASGRGPRRGDYRRSRRSTSREIGAIEISDGFSLVEVPESRARTSSPRSRRPSSAARR
jgi:ATP-dependent RNA helicase DeaD